MNKLCAPAIIYLLFSITQMLIDTYKGLYNTVGMKAIVTIMVTLLLNILCERGLGVISWIIVFVPFILMTVIVSMLLYVFGLDVASGTTNKKQDITNVTVDEKGNIIIYDPYYNPLVNPVYYKRPNVIVPKPISSLQTQTMPQQAQNIFSTSDPAYTS
jgi:hypothetical protein